MGNHKRCRARSLAPPDGEAWESPGSSARSAAGRRRASQNLCCTKTRGRCQADHRDRARQGQARRTKGHRRAHAEGAAFGCMKRRLSPKRLCPLKTPQRPFSGLKIGWRAAPPPQTRTPHTHTACTHSHQGPAPALTLICHPAPVFSDLPKAELLQMPPRAPPTPCTVRPPALLLRGAPPPPCAPPPHNAPGPRLLVGLRPRRLSLSLPAKESLGSCSRGPH